MPFLGRCCECKHVSFGEENPQYTTYADESSRRDVVLILVIYYIGPQSPRCRASCLHCRQARLQRPQSLPMSAEQMRQSLPTADRRISAEVKAADSADEPTESDSSVQCSRRIRFHSSFMDSLNISRQRMSIYIYIPILQQARLSQRSLADIIYDRRRLSVPWDESYFER